jgi:hypothetical protein
MLKKIKEDVAVNTANPGAMSSSDYNTDPASSEFGLSPSNTPAGNFPDKQQRDIDNISDEHFEFDWLTFIADKNITNKNEFITRWAKKINVNSNYLTAMLKHWYPNLF